MITDQQRQTRQRYIGSSDAAAVMGLDPYRSAADIFLEKTGQADGFAGNEHTERGNRLEGALLDFAEAELAASLSRNYMKVHDGGVLAANFDGIQWKVHNGTITAGDPGPVAVNDEPFIVECKTSSDPDEWGEPGTDQVPDRVIVQCHHQLYVAGPEFRVAYVPVLLPVYRKFDWRIYRIDRNDALAEAVAEHGTRFMREHVIPRIEPADFRPSLDVLKRVRREPNKRVPIDAALVNAFCDARDAAKVANDALDEAKRDVIAALADAEAGDCEDGRAVTFMECARKGYVVEPTTYRQLKFITAARAAKERR
jgi:putative phage-type endonuclease